jgi:hypothetical protein
VTFSFPHRRSQTKLLRDLDKEYHSRLNDGKVSTTGSDDADIEGNEMMRGIFDRVGSFVERTSNWAFSNRSNIMGNRRQIHRSMVHCRPTAVFSYDWRRPLPELCTSLHLFCEETVSCVLWGSSDSRCVIYIIASTYPSFMP